MKASKSGLIGYFPSLLSTTFICSGSFTNTLSPFHGKENLKIGPSLSNCFSTTYKRFYRDKVKLWGGPHLPCQFCFFPLCQIPLTKACSMLGLEEYSWRVLLLSCQQPPLLWLRLRLMTVSGHSLQNSWLTNIGWTSSFSCSIQWFFLFCVVRQQPVYPSCPQVVTHTQHPHHPRTTIVKIFVTMHESYVKMCSWLFS